MKDCRGKLTSRITGLAFFTWGITMLARTAFGYYTDPLGLTATQVGVANFLTSAMVCLSSVIIGTRAERRGTYREHLIVILVLCAASMLLLGWARSYGMVLISRVLLGIGCGPIYAMLLKMEEVFSPADQYAKNVGFVTTGEAVLNTICGPVILVFLLNHTGFGNTNLIFCAALLVLALAWLWGVGRFRSGSAAASQPRMPLRKLLQNMDLMLCVLGGTLTLTACWCIYMYLPSLLVQAGGFSDYTASLIMTGMGVFMTLWMILLPAAYRPERRWLLPAACLGSALALFAMSWNTASLICVGAFILLAGCASVASMFFMGILSVQSVPESQSASALALVNGGCEFFGASVGPLIAGIIADNTQRTNGILFAAICLLCTAVVGYLLEKRIYH